MGNAGNVIDFYVDTVHLESSTLIYNATLVLRDLIILWSFTNEKWLQDKTDQL